jgi:hypothetical protein
MKHKKQFINLKQSPHQIIEQQQKDLSSVPSYYISPEYINNIFNDVTLGNFMFLKNKSNKNKSPNSQFKRNKKYIPLDIYEEQIYGKKTEFGPFKMDTLIVISKFLKPKDIQNLMVLNYGFYCAITSNKFLGNIVDGVTNKLNYRMMNLLSRVHNRESDYYFNTIASLEHQFKMLLKCDTQEYTIKEHLGWITHSLNKLNNKICRMEKKSSLRYTPAIHP